MKIAFLGSRGIPARYSGFETFYEELGARLVERGHDVTVYNRSHFIKDVKGSYRGIKIVALPCIQTKHLETISHTLLSVLHAALQGYDIKYFCTVGNAPMVRLAGRNALLNVDGADFEREKWGRFASWYQQKAEKIATRGKAILIADALTVKRRYKDLYNAETIFAPYGGNIRRTEDTSELEKWNLKPRRYILYVGRLVPENKADDLVQAFTNIETDMKLVVVGDAPYADAYRRKLHDMAGEDVIFTGYAFGNAYAQLSSHAYLYVQPSRINGTRPAVLDQLGFGNCVLVRGSEVNRDVVADAGHSFEDEQGVDKLRSALCYLLDNPVAVEDYRSRATKRISAFYNWDWITDFYEELFSAMIDGLPLHSYDEFLESRR